MTSTSTTKTLASRLISCLTLFAILIAASLVTGCSDDDQEMGTEPQTYVYLVNLNEEPDLKSLTIVDSLNGRGSMMVPDIPAHVSNSFTLIIDRVDENRANISASQPNTFSPYTVVGSGFFTADSMYVELTIEGFTNRDIIAGTRYSLGTDFLNDSFRSIIF